MRGGSVRDYFGSHQPAHARPHAARGLTPPARSLSRVRSRRGETAATNRRHGPASRRARPMTVSADLTGAAPTSSRSLAGRTRRSVVSRASSRWAARSVPASPTARRGELAGGLRPVGHEVEQGEGPHRVVPRVGHLEIRVAVGPASVPGRDGVPPTAGTPTSQSPGDGAERQRHRLRRARGRRRRRRRGRRTREGGRPSRAGGQGCRWSPVRHRGRGTTVSSVVGLGGRHVRCSASAPGAPRPGRGLEGHPADAGEVDLGPGVGVARPARCRCRARRRPARPG